MKRFLYIVMILLVQTVWIRGEAAASVDRPSRFVNFTAEDGLSSNNVISILQDSKGFMWFGTENGLCRFDGAHMLVYKADDGLPGNLVTSLAEDSGGRIWAGTREGLCVLEDGRFVRWNYSDRGNYVRALHAAGDGSVWAAYFDSHLDRFTMYGGGISLMASIPYDMPSTIEGEYWYQQVFEDSSGALWLGGRKESAERLVNGEILKSDGRISGSFAQTPDGTLWGYDDFHPMLTRFDGDKFVDAFSIPVQHARLLCDRRGRLWAAGSYGLALIDTQTGASKQFLPEKEFNCIYEDRYGGIWLGGESGATLLSSVMNQVESFARGEEISAILQDRSGVMWTADGTRRESCLYEDSAGTIYLGLWTNRGFYAIDPVTGHRKLYSLPDERRGANWYSDFLEDSRGRFWAATWECWGLNEFDRRAGRFTDADPLHAGKGGIPSSARLASCLMEDSFGNLWYGTTECGLYCFSPEMENLAGFLQGKYVTCLAQAGDLILVGTKSGLYMIPDASRGRSGSESMPFPGMGMQVSSIEVDLSGRVWVSTVEGLYLLEEGGPARVEGRLGFNSEVYGLRVSCALNDGSLAFGGKNGYNVFHPDSLLASVSFPKILITWKKGGSPRTRQNDLSFDFGSTAYATARHAQYRYMLIGEDEDWIPAKWPEQGARYNNLSAGTYTLRIQASDELGRWPSEDSYSLRVRILPPLALSWPFMLLYAASLAAIVAVTTRLRERRLRREKAVLEATVAERTKALREEIDSKNSFFSIVSHDLKNPVIGMKDLSGAVYSRFDSLDPSSAKEALGKIKSASKHTADMLEGILLWAMGEKGMIRPDIGRWNLADIVSDAIDSVQEQAEAKNIKISVDGCGCDVLTDRNLLLTVFRNLLSNAVKFSHRDGSVEVVADGNDVLVRDHGVGMSAAAGGQRPGTQGEKGTGMGLTIVRELLDKLGGCLTVEPTPDGGCTFRISPSVPKPGN